ncbi:ras-related protein Rab-32-like [Penaeus indicus]|uniref:ras-related protein Rab-32-like n=1 Tax=Penaeus indicus TaxID=29960 RepID=UPI00300C05B6
MIRRRGPEEGGYYLKKLQDEEDSQSNNGEVPEMTERLFKVIIIGDPTVGKTSFVQRYVQDSFRRDYKGTVGVDFALKILKWSDSETIKLQLWDIAESFSIAIPEMEPRGVATTLPALIRREVRSWHMVIATLGNKATDLDFTEDVAVYSVSLETLVVSLDVIHRVVKPLGIVASVVDFARDPREMRERKPNCAFLSPHLFLTRGKPLSPILSAFQCDLPHRQVDQLEIEKLYKDHSFTGWTETSAKEGLMVTDSMRFLVDVMMKQKDDRDEDSTQSSLRLTPADPEKPHGCYC